MAQPINQQQPQTNQPQQPIGLDVNATLRTKEGLYIQGIRFNSTACKFLVLKATYANGSNPKQDCYLTANFTTQGANRGISLHLFDALNAQNWKIDDWSKAVKTGLNINKLRKPTPDEAVLVEALKKNEKDIGLQVFWKNPIVVEAAYSLNNPQTGTNSANKQNQIDNGMGSKPKQPSAAVQGAIEGMSEKNPALESTNIVFDRIIRESRDEFDILMDQAYESGYNYASDTIEDEDDILCKDEEMRPIFKGIFEDSDMLFNSWKEGYKKYVCNFLEIDHAVDYDSDYVHESKEGELVNKLNEKHFGVEQYFDCANYPNQLIQVAQFIKTCEDEGNIAVLTVQSTNGNVWHTQFTSESWQKFLKGLHGTDEFGRNSGVNTPKDGVAKVWAKDVDPKNSLGESKEIFDNLLCKVEESKEEDTAMFISYINNIFDDTGHMEVGKCPDCGMMLTDEDELEDGTHECPKCGSILEDHEDNDITGGFWDEEDEPEEDFWEIEDEDC